MSDLALYFRLIRFSVRSQMQYRFSFFLQVAGQFIVTFGECLA